MRGKKKGKKQLRVVLHKFGADRMIGGMKHQAVGCRIDGIGAAQQSKDKGFKPDVLDGFGYKFVQWKPKPKKKGGTWHG